MTCEQQRQIPEPQAYVCNASEPQSVRGESTQVCDLTNRRFTHAVFRPRYGKVRGHPLGSPFNVLFGVEKGHPCCGKCPHVTALHPGLGLLGAFVSSAASCQVLGPETLWEKLRMYEWASLLSRW